MTKEWAPVRPFEAWPEVEPIRYDTRQGTYVPDDSIEDRSVNRVAMAKVLGRGVRKLDVSTQGLNAGYYQKVNLPATDYDRSAS